jgi:hypothetical protein
MAKRRTRLVTKNSAIVNRPLPLSLLAGEAIVNTAEGIVLYSGVTTSTNEWTPAGTGTTANFFEVGSNLYDLRLRNRITTYEGETGVGLTGKFLSGTTNGFVLADISNIQGIDSYVSGATWNPNQLTLNLTENKPSVSVNIDAFSALTITNDLFVLGELTTNDLTISGTGIYDGVANGSNINEIVNWSSLTAHTSTTDRYVTGGTYDNNTALITFSGANNFPIFTVDLSTIDVNDTYVTGFTYNPSNNTLTISRNQGESNLTAQISSVTGLTISTLGTNKVVYTTGSGLLTTESEFEYNESTNTLTVGNINVQNPSGTTASIGQGGLVVGSGGSLSNPGIGDLTIHGNLTVFGSETVVATTELYVEDPQITLNYNPTGSTVVTSVAAGIKVQDGNGITSGDTYFTIGEMQNLTSGNTSEYTGLIGYINRGWVTQLNDIVIRNTNLNEGAPDGVRVLAEWDILDGGQY